MKRFIYLAFLLAVATSTRIAHAEEQEIRECDFKVKSRCVSGEARITRADGVLKKVEIFAHWCGQPGRLGYSCTFDVSRGDRDSTWSEEEGATLIARPNSFNQDRPDRVKVTVGRHLSIDLGEVQSFGNCGAAAELPRAIVIPAQRKACRVWLRAP